MLLFERLVNQVPRTSSRAMVLPGSMSMVVCFPSLMPASPVGVKVTWYFITCAEVLVTRTSDWKVELTPLACATAGMTRASGGGVLFDVGSDGETRLTETVVTVTVDDVAEVRTFDELPAAAVVIVMPPSEVPTGRPSVSACTWSERPPA